nr:TIGR01906 family membrane protein [Arthrobacter sp. zg-Y769]
MPEIPAADPGAAEAAGDGGTVPGGHPKVAQRSNLPMRRASTLPDLSGYASATSMDADEDTRTEDRDAPVREAAGTGAVASTGESAAESDSTESTATAVTPVVSGSSAAAVVDAKHADHDDADHDDADHADDVNDDHDNNHDVNDDHVNDDYPDDDHVDPALSAAEAQRRAQEREKAAAGKPVLARVLQVMIAVFFPVMVLAAAIRAVATPLFLWVEYHRPGFPADSYGFSTDDRMTYGSYAVDYLLNWSGSRYLGDLVGDGGEPLYLDSEVSHMADVKTVLTVAFIAATVMAVLSLVAALYLSRRSPGGIRRSLFSGAVLTLVLVAALVVLAVLGWEQFFTQLHTVFFANGNWTFRLDDTLIRLFPAQFWMDAGITIAALVLLTCTVVLVCCWPTRARRDRVRQAREDARRRYDESLEAL